MKQVSEKFSRKTKVLSCQKSLRYIDSYKKITVNLFYFYQVWKILSYAHKKFHMLSGSTNVIAFNFSNYKLLNFKKLKNQPFY